MVLVSNMILQDNLTEKSSNYGSESLKLCQHRAKFAERRHYDSEDIMVLLCQVISQDYVIKVPCHFMGRRPSREVTTLLRLVIIGTVVVEVIWFSFAK